MTRALDIGCGSQPQNPFNADEVFGVDIRTEFTSNVRLADLALEAIPFESGYFDWLTAENFIQYIPRVVFLPMRRNSFVEFMNEVHRVLKPGGVFVSLTPAYPHALTFDDPAQINLITEETFPKFFDDVNRGACVHGFTGAFHVIKQEWRGQHLYSELQKLAIPVSQVVNAEADRKISVFIPVFNGGKYIASTLDSVLMQTMTDFEVICIDDGSTDVSLSILHSYAARDSRVRVFRTPMNLGAVSKVLNYALQFMRGNYFVYSSQDDLFSPDWLEKMHDRAIVTGSDAVIPDLVFFHANDSAKDWRLSGLHGNRDIELSGRDAMLYSLRWEIPGNALWKSELVKRLKFEEFGMNSDEFSARVFFLNCNKVVFCSGVFYYRQDNELAVTKKTTFKTFDYPYTQFRLYELVRDHQFPVEIVHREALKVLEIMNTLRQWLVQHPTELSVDDREQAEARMEKCVVCLRNDPMFAAVI